MKIVEIFKSIQGEGTRAGIPTTFIRLFGCNLNCDWCDTKFSQYYSSAFTMSKKEIVKKIKSYDTRNLCITGGEPLLQVKELLELLELIYINSNVEDVVIETNGSISINELCIYRKSIHKRISIAMDYKLESSGMSTYMDINNFSLLEKFDEIKFIVANHSDFTQAKLIIERYYEKGVIVFSPVIDRYSPEHLAEDLLKYDNNNCRLSLQLHKYIWPNSVRGR